MPSSLIKILDQVYKIVDLKLEIVDLSVNRLSTKVMHLRLHFVPNLFWWWTPYLIIKILPFYHFILPPAQWPLARMIGPLTKNPDCRNIFNCLQTGPFLRKCIINFFHNNILKYVIFSEILGLQKPFIYERRNLQINNASVKSLGLDWGLVLWTDDFI